MNWKQLLSPQRRGEYKRNPQQKTGDLRSEFEKDYHRIIGSASFRRLQDKTQVFPLDKSDFIRTRLTHSLEVSSIAKSLGQNVAEKIMEEHLDAAFDLQTKAQICDILQCAGLIHDIGNPPFGHFGEDAIRQWFRKNMPLLTFDEKPISQILTDQMCDDFYNFEGNAQALRLVSKLHLLVNEYGMNLTYALLSTIIKYPVPSVGIDKNSGNIKDKKMGYFYAEQELYGQIATACQNQGVRHPLTYLLEAADDIAYCTADIEDAFKKGCIFYETLCEELDNRLSGFYPAGENPPLSALTHQYEKALQRNEREPGLYAVQNWMVRMQSRLIFCAADGFISHYSEIMKGSFSKGVFAKTEGEAITKALGEIAYEYVFTSVPIMKLEVAGARIIDYFLDSFVPAFLYYDTEQKLGMMEQKMVHLISHNYKEIYHYYAEGRSREEKLYLRLLLVTDYISGMTDSFAKDLFQELNGI